MTQKHIHIKKAAASCTWSITKKTKEKDPLTRPHIVDEEISPELHAARQMPAVKWSLVGRARCHANKLGSPGPKYWVLNLREKEKERIRMRPQGTATRRSTPSTCNIAHSTGNDTHDPTRPSDARSIVGSLRRVKEGQGRKYLILELGRNTKRSEGNKGRYDLT